MLDLVYKVESCRRLTATVAQLFLFTDNKKPLLYEAGQYLKVLNPDQSISPFSIANAPRPDSRLELHLLYLKENYRALEILRQAEEHKELRIRGPFGKCTAGHLAEQRPIIFIARGTGFAPIKAVIEALSAGATYPPMHFYWSVPSWPDLYLRELVEGWVKTLRDFRFTAVLTREHKPGEPVAKFGRVPYLVLQDYPDLSYHQVYASGPEALVYEALYDFQQHGLAREWFYSDLFDYQP